MNTIELATQKQLLQDIIYKGDESFYKLSAFVVGLISFIHTYEDEHEWARAAIFDIHKEEIKRRKSKSEATFLKFKNAILNDLEKL